jgi:hypothetical protein
MSKEVSALPSDLNVAADAHAELLWSRFFSGLVETLAMGRDTVWDLIFDLLHKPMKTSEHLK